MKTKTFKIILVLIISGYTGITRAQNNGTLLSGAGTNSLTPSTGSGSTNCFIGSGAGKLNSGGSDNVAVGDSALYSQSYGPGGSWYSYNVAIGNQALFSNLSTATTNGIQNIGIGVKALRENTTGNRNSVLGFEAMKLNTKASQNVAIGYQALYTQGTYATSATTYNVAVGYQALFSNQPTASNNGISNTGIGHSALYGNSTGYANTAVGHNSLFTNTTGNYNTAMGQSALYNNYATNNTANGASALYANTSGTQNTASGVDALAANTTGNYNSGFGDQALKRNTTGSYNSSLGELSGQTITTGSQNTCLGYGADVGAAASSNRGAFGYNAVNNQGNNTIWLGDANHTGTFSVGGQYTQSDGRFKFNVKEEVKGLEFINKLRPVTYQMNTEQLDDFKIQNMSDSIKARHKDGVDYTESSTMVHSGFIAQEINQAATACGFASSIVSVPADPNISNYGVNYAEIVVPLVKAVQELSKTVDSLKTVQSGQRTMNNDGQGRNETISQLELANKGNVILYQNEPNPFDGATVIRYFIPDNISGSAFVVFYDMYGKEVNKLEIKEKGFGKIEANTENLAAGIYSYSLLVDGKSIDTRKMIRNK